MSFDQVEFTGEETVVFLRPVAEGLGELQRVVHERAARLGVLTSDYYHPDRWIAHCTMAWRTPPDQFERAREALRSRAPHPSGFVTALGIIDTPAELELRRLEFSAAI